MYYLVYLHCYIFSQNESKLSCISFQVLYGNAIFKLKIARKTKQN